MSTRVERRTLLAAGTAAGAALVAGCAGGTELAGVRLRVADQAGSLRALFEASGALRGAPYEVSWRSFSADASVFEAFYARTADVGVSAAAPALCALGQRGAEAGVRIIAASRSAGRGGLAVLLPMRVSASSMRDLTQRPICPTNRGSSAHYLLLKALADVGMDPDDVALFYRWPALAQRAFRVGDVDALVIWDPYAASVQSEERATVLDTADDLDPGLMLLCASDETLADPVGRRVMADFRRRYQAAQRWALGPAEGYPQRLAQRCDLSLPAALRMAQRASWTDVALDERVAGTLQTVSNDLAEFGLLRRTVGVADYLRDAL